jgi:twitching motility protein PilT
MALFQSDTRDIVKKLSNKEFDSAEERDQLLAKLAATEGTRARDVVWMLFRPDRAIRETGAKILDKLHDPETIDLFITECRAKPEAVARAASATLFTINLVGVEQRLLQLLAVPDKETKETRETQDTVRRILLEAPATRTLEPVLWELAQHSTPEDAAPYLAKLATMSLGDIGLARWQKLARSPEAILRDRALEVLAARAPLQSTQILVEQLGVAGYSAKQAVIAALSQSATSEGPEFADRLLPLIASGDAATRTAVLKILIGLPNRADVVKRYLRFAKTLAGFARDRALESLRSFGPELIEPTLELLGDPDDDLRAAAIAVAGTFDDPRILPATIPMLQDSDWWIRINAAEALGRLKDPRAVEPLIAALADPEVKWSAVEALGRIGDPRALNALGRMLADPQPDIRIEAMQAFKQFQQPQIVPQILQALTRVATSDPDRTVRARALDIIEEMQRGGRAGADNASGDMTQVRNAALAARPTAGEPRLNALLIQTRNSGASDFHLSVGQPPIVRLAADLVRVPGEPFTAEQTESMLREILTELQWEVLQRDQQLDFCYFIQQAGRYRANVFLDHKGYHGVFRVIPEKPPTIAELGLPPHLAEIADYHQGLVLICGPSGSGKSTTLAALVNLFNETRNDHILTMEDPVEFVHPFKNCLINQREVGTHTRSFSRALRAALREDPDVIVIGELRDNESISLALTAAETGHIVLGTLNSTSAAKAIDRIISSFPVDEQPQIRAGLSEALKYAIAQRLLPAKEARKQVAVFEILKGTSTIANMIRDEKTYQIYSAMQIGRSQGMQTFDEALKDLVRREQIAPETAYMAAQKKEDFEPLVSAEFLRELKP